MKVLVVTRETQGLSDLDFCRAVEGELASYGIDCDAPGCGCTRAWLGVSSHKPSTTVKVAEMEDLTVEQLAEMLTTSMLDQGWGKLATPDELAADALEVAIDLADDAGGFPVGAILERERDDVKVRGGLA